MIQADSRVLMAPSCMAYGGISKERKEPAFANRSFPNTWVWIARMPHKRFVAAMKRVARANGDEYV